MSKSQVIGLGFGDEGKGLVTDYLVSKANNPLVVRYSGGQQAGHTVVLGDRKHVFSTFGSGSLRGAPTYWLDTCTTDPFAIITELRKLKKKGCNPALYIHPKSPVTTPWDKIANQEDSQNRRHGTCGAGVGKTWQREEDHYSLLFEDLFYQSVLEVKIEMIRRYYGISVEKELRKGFLRSCEAIRNSPHVIKAYTSDIPNYMEHHFIYEGSQGLLLDKDIGFFPHVTRANVGVSNVEWWSHSGTHYYLVTRAYQTRHGNGPLTYSDVDHGLIDDDRETNEHNKYQGVFRKSILDLDMIQYGLQKDFGELYPHVEKTLVITCLDHMTKYVLAYNNDVIEFGGENQFVTFIKTKLGVENLLLSKSPESVNIEALSTT